MYNIILDKIKKENNLDGLFLIKNANIRYISGFTGDDSYILLSPEEKFFITDARYTEQAKIECKDFTVVEWRKNNLTLHEFIAQKVQELGINRLGFEREVMTYYLYNKLEESMHGAKLVPTSGIVESLRYVKSQFEIECIKKAASFADEAFEKILDFIKPGLTENEIVLELEYYLGKAGSQGAAYPIILVSGKKTSMPHGVSSNKKIEYGDFITIDFGGLYNGYRSDMTRTIVVGKPNDEQKKVYSVIKEAQKRGVAVLRDGIVGNIPDMAVREVIDREGYIDRYYPGLGHGLGLEIHEEPFMGAKCTRVLKSRCVVTIEPGIYIPNWGGVRIEDTVVVLNDGVEILTKSPKELLCI